MIWGIDGDWMVNIIPAGVPFYPTDHCGVLRIKTEKILPEYMMYALQAEGEYERFSRNNRAYVLCGDNQYRKEYGVQPEQILAALTGFYRGNQYIDCEKNKKYKQYVKLWCSPLFPRRCAVWAVKAVMKIRSRASKR